MLWICVNTLFWIALKCICNIQYVTYFNDEIFPYFVWSKSLKSLEQHYGKVTIAFWCYLTLILSSRIPIFEVICIRRFEVNHLHIKMICVADCQLGYIMIQIRHIDGICQFGRKYATLNQKYMPIIGNVTERNFRENTKLKFMEA